MTHAKTANRAVNAQQTRKHILNVAFWEIFQHGFNGVSVNEIIAKTTVTKGAFFHHFPTKNDLGYAIVDEILRDLIYERWITPLAKYKNPVQGISTNLKKIISNTTNEELALGCPLNNLIQEMSAIDPIFSRKLHSVLELWIVEIQRYIIQAQKDGYIKKAANPRHIAEFIVMAHEGAFGMSKSYKDVALFSSLQRSLQTYLQSVNN